MVQSSGITQIMEYEQKVQLYRGEEDEAWQLFRRAPAVHFAGSDEHGAPILRTFNAVVLDGRLCFHGRDGGEKLGLIGGRAMASYEEVVADVASYWIHPELACPASTYYVSAIAEGSIDLVTELKRKARVLSALMQRFQPEGGYAPIEPNDKRYAKVVEQLMVAELVPTRVSCKKKLGQNRTRAQIERVLEGLWQRGEASDLLAIRTVRAAHPAQPLPAFLRAPSGIELCVAPDEADSHEVAALLEGQYWTKPFTLERMAAAQRGSDAWVVARADGKVVGSARAISDGARFGYVLDVVVHPAYRARGIGKALTALLLEHPALRGLAHVKLRTRDAQSLYRRFGFMSVPPDALGEDMVLARIPSH